MITDYIEGLDYEMKEKHMAQLEDGEMTFNIDGKDFALNKEMISFEKEEKRVMVENYIPHVIEPSFGLGRIMYCIFEHCFKMRESDGQRTYFDFPAKIAPVKCSIFPLINQKEMNQKAFEMSK